MNLSMSTVSMVEFVDVAGVSRGGVTRTAKREKRTESEREGRRGNWGFPLSCLFRDKSLGFLYYSSNYTEKLGVTKPAVERQRLG